MLPADDDFVECPDCGYRVTHLRYLMAKADFPCPRCGQKHYSQFKPIIPPDRKTLDAES